MIVWHLYKSGNDIASYNLELGKLTFNPDGKSRIFEKREDILSIIDFLKKVEKEIGYSNDS